MDLYKHVLDEVDVNYDDRTRKYRIVFHKLVEGASDRPVRSIYARIVVSIFPDEFELARRYYALSPLVLENVAFRVYDDNGDDLVFNIIQYHNSNVEFDVLFKHTKSGREFPLHRGNTQHVYYSIEISDNMWGPYLERRPRVHTDEIRVRLNFDSGIAAIWGNTMSATDDEVPIAPPIQSASVDGRTEHTWSTTAPQIGARYRFRWTFADLREVTFLDEFRNKQALAVRTHSPDYRQVIWNGVEYTFTVNQAAVIAALWEAWESGIPALGETELMDRAGGSGKRIRDVFKYAGSKGMHPAWRQMIIGGMSKGTWKLA